MIHGIWIGFFCLAAGAAVNTFCGMTTELQLFNE